MCLACGGGEPVTVPEGTLPDLDSRTYVQGMQLHAHHFPGENRPGKLQMMAHGERRYLFQLVFPGDTWDFLRSKGQILDVTDPLAPVVVNEDAFFAFSINLAYHAASDRWVLMESKTTFGDPDWWAILLLHVTIEAGIWSTWGGTIPILPGTRTLHWGIHTQLAVHGGLLDAAEVPISIEGKSRLQLLDELSAFALQRANGVRDYGGKNWRFVRAAANNRVHPADAPSRSVRTAPTRRASSLGLGGRRHETANMLPWF